MRVSITHHAIRRGLLFRRTLYDVRLEVHFTHEERQVIRQRRLEETVLLERRPADARNDARDDRFVLRVSNLVRGPDSHVTATPGDAKLYQLELLQALEQLKLWVSANADVSDRTVVEF